MTEDDTFRILTRKTIQEMAQLIAKSKPSEILTVLADNGWTYDEYFAALQEQAENKSAVTPIAPPPAKKEKLRVYDGFGVETRSEVGQNVNDFWKEDKVLKSTK